MGDDNSVIADSLDGFFYMQPIRVIHIQTILLKYIYNFRLKIQVYEF